MRVSTRVTGGLPISEIARCSFMAAIAIQAPPFRVQFFVITSPCQRCCLRNYPNLGLSVGCVRWNLAGIHLNGDVMKLSLLSIQLAYALIVLCSCHKEAPDFVQPETTDTEIQLRGESVADVELILLIEARNYQMSADSLFMPLLLTVRDAEGEVPALGSFFLNGMRMTDDGSGNDRVAFDGIYTSEKCTYFQREEFEGLDEEGAVAYSNFAIEASSLSDLELALGLTVSVTCEMDVVECPNTSWYNTSIFGEPCIEFSDCTVTVEWEF